MKAHTPGPWRVEVWSYSGGLKMVPTIQNDRDAVAQVLDLWPPDAREAERDANARLIAKAPEMRDALDAIRELSEPDSEYSCGRVSTGMYRVIEAARALLAEIDGINPKTGRVGQRASELELREPMEDE